MKKYTEEERDQLRTDPANLRCYLDRMRFKKAGRDYVTSCPWHGTDKTPSLKLHNKSGKWDWCCYGCGNDGGDVFSFVMKADNIGFAEAIRKVDEEINGRKPSAEAEENRSNWKQSRDKVEKIFKAVAEDNEERNTISLESYRKLEIGLQNNADALKWLKDERGITAETAAELHLGYRQSIGKLAGRTPDVSDRGWLTFPCIQDDKVVSLKYRSIAKKAFSRQPGMQTALFNTECIDPFEPVFLTEGEFDAAVLVQAGFCAVSLPSAVKTLPVGQKDLLMEADKIVLAGDCDGAAGSDAMAKLWRELGKRTYLLKWPEGMKDANQTFLEYCRGDVNKFRELVDRLAKVALARPMDGVYSLQETMENMQDTNLIDHPSRFRFPWKAVDEMAIILPGSVNVVSATNTGQGKTSWVAQATLYAAREHGEVVLNYQCEMSPTEFATMLAAHVLRKDRNVLTPDDTKRAAKAIAGAKYYVGFDPDLTTAGPVLDLIEAAIPILGATVVILDHKHFIIRNEENQTQAEANADQRIKRMAAKFGVKFFVLGQPRKATQQNKGKAIHITDLKGSETGASDANNVFFLHREVIHAKDPNNPPPDEYDPTTQIHRKKARFCGPGKAYAELMFDGKTATFVEIDYHAQP